MRTTAAIAAIAAAVALLACAPLASADYYAGQRPAGPAAIELSRMAEAFWAARHVVGCADGIEVLQAPSLAGGDGPAAGRGGDCVIWISDFDIEPLDRIDADATRAEIRFACVAIYHEVGHALGLPHTPTGLMAVVPATPWECEKFAEAHDDEHPRTATYSPSSGNRRHRSSRYRASLWFRSP